MGRKLGGGCALLGGSGSLSNTKSPGPRPTSIPSDILINLAVFATTDMGQNWEEGQGSWVSTPSNIVSPGPRPTSVPSGMLIHPSVWPQQTCAKIGRLCPFGEGELGPHLTKCGRCRSYLHAKLHLDPSNRLATIYQLYRQDRQDCPIR